MKIMICYDGTESAHKALEMTIDYFKPKNPLIIIVTVVDEPKDASMANEEIFEKWQEEHHNELKKTAEWVAEHGLEVDAVLAVGEPRQMILDAINKRQPDIVVIARQRKSALERHFIESVSAYMVRHSASPLLIMGPAYDQRK